MKTFNIKILGILAVLLIVASCDESSEVIPPGPVTEAEATPGHGEVILKWTNPDDEDFYYVDISFTDSQGAKRSSKVSRFVSGDTIIGFADTNPYTFTIVAYNRSGGGSQPTTVSATPLQPVFTSVINAIEVEPDFGGAIVLWENETGKPVTIKVNYIDDTGEKATVLFTANESGRGYISGLTSKPRSFDVVVSDKTGNNSNVRTFEITPLVETEMDKSMWSVVDFSSQEPAEGAPNGLVSAVFDGDISTFWHTQWAGGSPGYPHWFIIDLGQNTTISRLVSYRRQNDGRGQTAFQFLTSLDGEVWEDQGIWDFDAGSNAGQSYRLISNPEARYFKYVALEGPEFFAFLGEITVYGSTE